MALSPKGEALARRRNREAVAFHARLLSCLEPEDARRLLDILGRMTAAADNRAENCV